MEGGHSPTELAAWYRLITADFFVWPAVLATIHETMSGLPPNRNALR